MKYVIFDCDSTAGLPGKPMDDALALLYLLGRPQEAEILGITEYLTRKPRALSGGQRQRIALARAVAKDSSLIILDDTTSAVDMETEKAIQHSLNTLDFECTKVIIAQRISTTKSADKILILQHGEITEEGTHEELIAKKGYYYELVQLQTGGDI